jgi:hypothetical protein
LAMVRGWVGHGVSLAGRCLAGFKQTLSALIFSKYSFSFYFILFCTLLREKK